MSSCVCVYVCVNTDDDGIDLDVRVINIIAFCLWLWWLGCVFH